MKKTDAIQLVVIVLALLSAFKCIEAGSTFIIYMIMWFEGSGAEIRTQSILVTSILSLAAYLLFAIYGIRNSGKIAELIGARASASPTAAFQLSLKEMLYLTCAGIAIYGIITSVPGFTGNLYEYLTGNNDGPYKFNTTFTRNAMIREGMSASLSVILLIYSQTFADMLYERIDNRQHNQHSIDPQ